MMDASREIVRLTCFLLLVGRYVERILRNRAYEALTTLA